MTSALCETVLSVTAKLRTLPTLSRPQSEPRPAMREISPRDYAALSAAGASPFLLDVREGWEVAIVAAPGATHIPMGEIPGRLAEIPTDREIVVLCKVGGRSLQVALFLEARGYHPVANLTGGILAWAAQVDPALATY